MADKSYQLILTALSRAAAAGTVPLHGNKTIAGLFPTTAAGKQAAQRCQEDGYLRLADETPSAPPLSPPILGGDKGEGSVATQVKKKTASAPLCTITEKGLAYLLSQVSPRQVLEDFVRALEARRDQTDDLIGVARQMQHGIEALKANAEKILQQICQVENSAERGNAAGSLKTLFAGFLNDSNPSRSAPSASASEPGLDDAILTELTRWEQAGASEDCPLPHLHRHASPRSIGQFHDTLRQLHDLGKIYLHPWTGPLYDIPEPPYALLIGHEIAYYASVRK